MNRTQMLLTAALLLCTNAAVAQNTIFRADGDFASTSFCSQYNFCVGVNVFRGTANGALATFLVYDYFSFNPSTGSSVDRFGYGVIPNSAFQLQGPTDSLNIDTSRLQQGFTNTLCTYDPNTGNTCVPGPGGVVSVSWNFITPQIGFSQSGTVISRSPGATFTFAGTSDFLSALVTTLDRSARGLGMFMAALGNNTTPAFHCKPTDTPQSARSQARRFAENVRGTDATTS